MFLENELAKRALPALKSRAEMLAVLQDHLFGKTPETPEVQSEILQEYPNAFGGKALWRKLSVSFETPKGKFSFPADLILPLKTEKPRLMVHILFDKEHADRFFHAEEIIDQGVGLALFGYQDITADNGDFQSGLAACYPREENACGKIGLWAFAASRLLDALLAMGADGGGLLGIAGHSRLGKTALWCGAQDARFSLVMSNESGAGGASLARGKPETGERVFHLNKNFPFWFCQKYGEYSENENAMPFDQHMLLAAVAPRLLYIASAQEDLWADPAGEFLAAYAASEAYGGKGLQTEDRYPQTGELLHGGKVGYHMRGGKHFFSREDWRYLLQFWFAHEAL